LQITNGYLQSAIFFWEVIDADFTALLASALPAYLRDLEAMVQPRLRHVQQTGVDAVGRIMQERLREFGAEVTVLPRSSTATACTGAGGSRQCPPAVDRAHGHGVL